MCKLLVWVCKVTNFLSDKHFSFQKEAKKCDFCGMAMRNSKKICKFAVGMQIPGPAAGPS